MLRIIFLVITLSFFHQVSAQKYWHLKSPDQDKIYGAGVGMAYQLLNNRPSQPVTVAIIDIGVDVHHQDLKDIIWTNSKEVSGNNVDDDENGYVDDTHGWNFLGGNDGNIMYEATEETRLYQRYKRLFWGVDSIALSNDEKKELARFRKLQQDYNKAQQSRIIDAKSSTQVYEMNKKLHWKILFRLLIGKGAGHQIRLARELNEYGVVHNFLDADSLRRIIVGDDPENNFERNYGNNDVIGPDASHGTHAAGIVASCLNSSRSNIRIMALRAVPWGDERDKDIANAIRYAVDNGASIISMSFGKNLSPNKFIVDSAVKYALQKDVLFVHAAGNDSKNTDTVFYYPGFRLLNGATASNWIEVGASGKIGGGRLVAGFSNFGKNTVDLFAPGVKIYSTLPGNKHGYESGTSMAAPLVAGVAAIIRSYFPELNAMQVKELLMNTVTICEQNDIPRSPTNLCVSGGIINAEKAVSEMLNREEGYSQTH